MVDGVGYAATSRFAASFEMARLLGDPGILDQPVAVMQDGIAGCITYPSLHRMARHTIKESATHPVHHAQWQDPAAAFPRVGQNGDISASVVQPAPPDAPGPCFAATGDAMSRASRDKGLRAERAIVAA